MTNSKPLTLDGASISYLGDSFTEETNFGLRVLAQLPANVFIHDLTTNRMTFYNRALSEALGYSDSLHEDQPDGMAGLMHPDDRVATMQIRAEESSATNPLDLQCRLRHADGSWRWFGVRLVPFEMDPAGRPTSVLGVAGEITVLKRREEELEHQAGHDLLTGLPNRRRFLTDLSAQIACGVVPFTIVCCDIDKFKSINDQYGHAAGDDALKAFAELLRTGVRSDDLVGRLGGDEFALLLRHASAEQGRLIIDRIRLDFARRQFGTALSTFSATASFGLVEFQAGWTAEKILAEADVRLYGAKRNGRDRVCG